MVAIAEDDVEKLKEFNYTTKELISKRFEEGMNILNLAIDSNRVKIVKFLAAETSDTEKKILVNHFYMGISAIHQVVSLGQSDLIKIVIEDFGADLSAQSML